MTVGFCIVATGREVAIQLLGRGRSNGILSVCGAGGSAVALLGRLHHRDELRTALDPWLCDPAGLDDAGLVLEAYRQHGRPGLTRLEGTLVIVI
jgi:hypothetical protein